jgi:hypothetical protein
LVVWWRVGLDDQTLTTHAVLNSPTLQFSNSLMSARREPAGLPEDFLRRQVELAGWPITIETYNLAGSPSLKSIILSRNLARASTAEAAHFATLSTAEYS